MLLFAFVGLDEEEDGFLRFFFFLDDDDLEDENAAMPDVDIGDEIPRLMLPLLLGLVGEDDLLLPDGSNTIPTSTCKFRNAATYTGSLIISGNFIIICFKVSRGGGTTCGDCDAVLWFEPGCIVFAVVDEGVAVGTILG